MHTHTTHTTIGELMSLTPISLCYSTCSLPFCGLCYSTYVSRCLRCYSSRDLVRLCRCCATLHQGGCSPIRPWDQIVGAVCYSVLSAASMAVERSLWSRPIPVL